MTSNAGTAYAYYDTAHKHAATHLGGVQKFWYDANGNMTTRITTQGTYNLTYDQENRLTGVSGAATATFVYDGDGNRVKGTVDGVTTTYIGNYLEWTGSTSTMKKYYYADATRVAMREGSTLYYLLGDHLGSTALTLTNTGGLTSEVRYKAFGEDRYTYGTTPTTYRYTGQRNESGLGLYYYGARWYDAYLNRWIQPDSDVPESQGVQALDRYAFVNNNPIRWIDPTGHSIDCGIGEPNCQAGVIVPRIVSRGEWGAMEPGNHRSCSDLGACVSTGYNEGAYDATTNPSGYAEYSQLYPDQSLAGVLNTAVIHHEGDFQDYSVQGVQRSHMYGNGWMDIGYHYVIGTDGTIYEGRSISARGSHVTGGNSRNIGILFLGDFNPGMEVGTLNLPFDLYNGDDFGPTGAQVSSAMLLLEWLDNTYGIDSVVGHGDIPNQNTRCPGSYCQPYVERFNNAFGSSAK